MEGKTTPQETAVGNARKFKHRDHIRAIAEKWE